MKRLACLTNSYKSHHLLETLAELGIHVHLGPGVASSDATDLRIIGDSEVSEYLACGELKLYINAEDSLGFLEARSGCEKLKRDIAFFKDKYEFRRSIKEFFPDFFLEKVSSAQLETVTVPEDRELILKPALGFHSLGIRSFKGTAQLRLAVREALNEIRSFGHVFDSKVLSEDVFIIEDFIDGEELACDAFFDCNGEPIINAIYCHVFADRKDTRDLVYYTSSSVMEKYLGGMLDFLKLIATKTTVRNFPLHLEVRVSNGIIIPIEVNPLRFGGFGLADLARHAFGINSYRNYFLDEKPDWDGIIARKDMAFYAFVVGQRPDVFDPLRHGIDHAAYRATFSNLLEYVPIDASRYRFFSTAFARSEELPELLKYLHMDFSQFRTGT